MVTSNLMEERQKILDSNLTPVSCIEKLQIGRKFVLLNVCDKFGDHTNPFIYNKNFKVVRILSVTPKIDQSKISSNLTYDSLDRYSSMYFDEIKEGIDNFDFREYVSKSYGFDENNCMKYGWLYYKVEYQDVYSKEIKTDIIFDWNSGICFEYSKMKPDGRLAVDMDNYADRLFASDIFEYDVVNADENDMKQRYCKEHDLLHLNNDKSIVDSVKKIKATELHDLLIKNFRIFLAKSILMNRGKVNDKNTIDIDGVTWYNGFYNDIDGVIRRDYLFYRDIPNGWRLPTIKELTDMLSKHPLIRKELPDTEQYEYVIAVRNNAGMECRCSSYFDRERMHVMTLDSNDYANEKTYFPCGIKTVKIGSCEESHQSPREDTWNNGYRPYLIMLVKMTDDEVQKEKEWAKQVLEENIKYDTIDSIYEKFGVNIDNIAGITFDVTKGKLTYGAISSDSASIKTYERKAGNKHFNMLMDAIAKYIGNDGIYNAKEICIKFKGENEENSGELTYDSSKQCDMRDFLTHISPLLCKDICKYDINDVDTLTRYNSHDDTYNINDMEFMLSKLCLPVDMYFYVKNALASIGVMHDILLSEEVHYRNSYYSSYHSYVGTAYISRMVLHMTDGTDVTINELPLEYFNASKLYMRELADKTKYSDEIKKFRQAVMKKKH